MKNMITSQIYIWMNILYDYHGNKVSWNIQKNEIRTPLTPFTDMV